MKILKNPTEIPFDRLADRFDLASMQLSSLSTFQPAVFKKRETETPGYGVRILAGASFNSFNGTRRTSWEYFYMNADGIIIESPRGLAKQYNGRYKVTGLEEAVEKYKEMYVNHN